MRHVRILPPVRPAKNPRHKGRAVATPLSDSASLAQTFLPHFETPALYRPWIAYIPTKTVAMYAPHPSYTKVLHLQRELGE